MKLGETIHLSLSALARHKVRTALTVLGVAIGTFTLVASLSVGNGVEAALLRQFRKSDRLRKIALYRNYEAKAEDIPAAELKVEGPMTDAKRARLRTSLVRRWQSTHGSSAKPVLTAANIAKIAAMPHVAKVVPAVGIGGDAAFGDQTADIYLVGEEPGEPSLNRRLVAGRMFVPGRKEALVHEALLYRLGITDEAAVEAILGKPIRAIYRVDQRSPNRMMMVMAGAWRLSAAELKALDEALQRLPEVLDKSGLTPEQAAALKKLIALKPKDAETTEQVLNEDYTVVGVIREWEKADLGDDQPGWGGASSQHADLVIPIPAAVAFQQRSPAAAEEGFQSATVTVDKEENVRAVYDALKAQGQRGFSLAEIIDQVRANVVMITFAVAFVAVVALVVAALGITNTMIMSVLERTREIGVMKAVGARDRDIQMLFLVEGATIGVLGGATGLLMAWGASFPADAVARRLMEAQTQSKLDQSLFVFPIWIALGVPLTSALVTTLAAFYPARRASRLDPITALRHD